MAKVTSSRGFILLVAAMSVLAGCTGASDDAPDAGEDVDAAAVERVELKADRGAVTGLVVDDAFRPIPNALVLAQEIGETTRSNANGEFQLVDLKPGSVTLRVEAEGHEASPREVDVVAGEYAEVTLSARRVANTHGEVITQEFTVFIACSVDFIVNGIAGGECVGDLSGDSGRAGFTANYTEYGDATYLVTEMKTNQEGRWEVQLRSRNQTSESNEQYAAAQIQGDYVKIVHKLGEKNSEYEAVASYGENVPWTNQWPVQTILFADNPGREEFQSAGLPVCCGVGVTMGIEAKFVQSLFIGEPTVNIENYATMSPG